MITKSTLDTVSGIIKTLEDYPFKGRFKAGIIEVPGKDVFERVPVFVKIEGAGDKAKAVVSFPDEDSADLDKSYKALKDLIDE